MLNAHLPMDSEGRAHRSNLDFKNNQIPVRAHNFRIGDLNDPFVKNHLKGIQSASSTLLQAFYKLTGSDHWLHGNKTGKNLYLEFVHFPVGTGYIDKHTHESISDFGLKYNFLGLLTSKGEDYEEGGVLFYDQEYSLDLRDTFKKGDLILFNNRTLHEVIKIESNNPKHIGRWIYTFFYY